MVSKMSLATFYSHDDEEDEHDDAQQDSMFYDVYMSYEVIHRGTMDKHVI